MVYVVNISYDYEGEQTLAVFTTRELAQAYCNRDIDTHRDYDYVIHEMLLDPTD